MRVLRIYHGGRDAAHRLRDQALVAAGVDLTLVVPTEWPGPDEQVGAEPEFATAQFAVRRPGDVNRHTYTNPSEITRLCTNVAPDLVDIHEEPVSAVLHQLINAFPRSLPMVCYTAQNLDKRFPPPFAQWERQAYSRIWGVNACSRQAASVATGKGFGGTTKVLALGTAPNLTPGEQSLSDPEVRLGLIGRMVPEKGVADALEVLAAVNGTRPARLVLIGDGPEIAPVLRQAEAADVRDRVDHVPWTDSTSLADLYRGLHVVLVPSMATTTWVEQFGRVVTEAQAAGCVVAAYASGSLPEVVGDTGLLVAAGDRRALVAGVLSLLADDRWRAYRQRGLDRAPSLTWKSVAEEQVAFYGAVVAAGPPPRARRGARPHARLRFGEPAMGPGSPRPFALPVLRSHNALTMAAERVIDLVIPQ